MRRRALSSLIMNIHIKKKNALKKEVVDVISAYLEVYIEIVVENE